MCAEEIARVVSGARIPPTKKASVHLAAKQPHASTGNHEKGTSLVDDVTSITRR